MQSLVQSVSESPRSWSVRVDQSGRIVIPAELRARFHFQPGDEAVLEDSGSQISLRSYDQVLAAAQAYFQSQVEPGVSLVDELLADRHAEAAREAAESAGNYD